jgi:RNA polymerase sigma-70 factor (ECF subfamily)
VANHDAWKPNSRGNNEIGELLLRARGGDQQSIGELLQQYRRYMNVLAATKIHSRLQRRISASDIVQETMLKAHRHFAQFQGESEREFLAWLRQILINSLAGFVEQHVLAARRDVRREVSLEQLDVDMDDSTSRLELMGCVDGESPSSLAQQREDAAKLVENLAKLPARYRQVLLLRNIQGLSFEEVAARLNRSLGSTRMLWLRAMDRLRAVYWRTEQYVK